MTKIYNFDSVRNSSFCQKNNIKLDWENEVLTEYKTYQYLSNNNIMLPLDYIAYPWALLIDLYHNKYKQSFSSLYHFLSELNLLDQLSKKNYITTVQSYHFKKFLDVFKKIGIKYIFSPHITKKDFLDIFYQYDIIVFPYIIYPSIQIDDNNKNSLGKHRLYNFIGNINYSSERPTTVRNNIVKMKHLPNTVVKGINKWHFNEVIYGEQLKLIDYQSIDIFKEKTDREDFYRKTMETSLFCICPLGIGPNSIRLWESFTYNTIPISISNDLWLPFYLDVNWDDLIVNIKEKDYEEILNINKINQDRIRIYQNEGLKFYKNYLTDSKFGNLTKKVFKNNDKFNLLVPWYNITDEKRYLEIHRCLQVNLNNEHIKQVIFFYETDNRNMIDFENYNHPKIKIIPVITSKKRDISFNRLIKYANENLLNQLCIISNNDIYFDDTLTETYKLDFYKNNYFLALTRKNYGKYLDSNNQVWKPHSASQDSWIFRTPIQLIKETINLGWIQCDNIIAEKYYSLGYNVINPHYSINGWHLHMYNNTNHLLENYNYNYEYKMKRVPLETIDTILKNSIKLNQINVKLELPELIKPKKVNKINVNKLSEIKKKWLENNLEIN